MKSSEQNDNERRKEIRVYRYAALNWPKTAHWEAMLAQWICRHEGSLVAKTHKL